MFNKESEKHFLYVCYLFNRVANLEIFSKTNNTIVGHCLERQKKTFSARKNVKEAALPNK